MDIPRDFYQELDRSESKTHQVQFRSRETCINTLLSQRYGAQDVPK